MTELPHLPFGRTGHTSSRVIFGAAALGCVVTLRTGDPVYACVVAWALSAVASDGGKRTSETLGDAPLKALAKSARWSARIALAGVVASQVVASLAS